MGYIGNFPTAVPLSSNDLADGIVTNTKLANSSLTVNGTTISLGGSDTITAGKIIQIAHATINPATQSTTGNTFVSAGNKVSITPTSASNKILILVNGGCGYVANSGTRMHTAIYRAISGGTTTNITNANEGAGSYYDGNADSASPHSYSVVDTTYNTTSAIDYELYYRNHNNSGLVYQNVSWAGILSIQAIEFTS